MAHDSGICRRNRDQIIMSLDQPGLHIPLGLELTQWLNMHSDTLADNMSLHPRTHNHLQFQLQETLAYMSTVTQGIFLHIPTHIIKNKVHF